MLWSPASIADAVYEGFRNRAAQDDVEQAVYGFDSLDELGLHPLVHQSLRDAGYGVFPEQRYPSAWENPKQSEGLRCDVVITAEPPGKAGIGLRDPRLRGTLFDTLEAVEPEEAYWLEIKTVSQYTSEGPFKGYSRELLSPVADDVKKLWADPFIFHSGLLLLLFTESQEVAEHDLLAWHDRCLKRGYPVASPAARGFAISNRIGNGWCAVAVFGVRGV
ncbi:MAG: hypothetical protein WD768_22800 [Phycisphaeraceae bacterium]